MYIVVLYTRSSETGAQNEIQVTEATLGKLPLGIGYYFINAGCPPFQDSCTPGKYFCIRPDGIPRLVGLFFSRLSLPATGRQDACTGILTGRDATRVLQAMRGPPDGLGTPDRAGQAQSQFHCFMEVLEPCRSDR